MRCRSQQAGISNCRFKFTEASNLAKKSSSVLQAQEALRVRLLEDYVKKLSEDARLDTLNAENDHKKFRWNSRPEQP